MKSKFRIIDRSKNIQIDADFHSVLPEDSLARFIMDVVDQLAESPTGMVGGYQDAPLEPVTIESVTVSE